MYIKKTHQQYLFIKEKDLKFSTAAWMKLPGKKIMEWRGSRSKNYSFSNSYRNTKPRQRRGFQLVEKVRFLFCASCDSTHKIEFAQQIHKNRGRVPRFLYKGRKNVSGGRGFSSAFDRKRGFDREAARKTIVFRQPQAHRKVCLSLSKKSDFYFVLRATARIK